MTIIIIDKIIAVNKNISWSFDKIDTKLVSGLINHCPRLIGIADFAILINDLRPKDNPIIPIKNAV